MLPSEVTGKLHGPRKFGWQKSEVRGQRAGAEGGGDLRITILDLGFGKGVVRVPWSVERGGGAVNKFRVAGITVGRNLSEAGWRHSRFQRVPLRLFQRGTYDLRRTIYEGRMGRIGRRGRVRGKQKLGKQKAER